MKKNLANLLKVKTIISLAVIFTTCYLTIVKQLDTETFMVITSAIITYYFNRKEDKENDI